MGLGLGIRGGLYTRGATGGGGVGSGVVFASPITGDTTTQGGSPADHPATWVLVGAAVWLGIVYFHFHVY